MALACINKALMAAHYVQVQKCVNEGCQHGNKALASFPSCSPSYLSFYVIILFPIIHKFYNIPP